jgi:hypothetical protein
MMITGERLLIYLGVSFMLIGAYTIVGDALSLTPSIVAALGGFIFSIGLIMSYVGFMGKDKEKVIAQVSSAGNPLGFLNAAIDEIGINDDGKRKADGNRAIGFVLIAIGVFLLSFMVGFPFLFFCCAFPDVISLFGVLGMLFASPLALLGMVCLSFGLSFRRLMHSR